MFRIAVLYAAFALTAQSAFAAERARTVAEATGFIQVIGDFHREINEGGLTRVVDRSNVAISAGTGFVFSPHGYVLTNHHVIRDGETVATSGGAEIRTTTKTSRIEVCLPQRPGTPRGVRAPCAQASVYFSDPEVDLAVLYLGLSDLPYLAMGDSDAVGSGQRVDVWGFPLGGTLEIGRDAASNIAPGVSGTSGSVAALRKDDSGEIRFLQINTNINLGNSGGPVVDQEGFVVGVVQSKLAGADGIAFAVPVNMVKTVLESRGLDAVLDVRRLRLGSEQVLDAKGVTLRLPLDMTDTSPLRARVAAASLPAEIEFRLDRVFTPWPLNEIERSLLNTPVFESFPMTRSARLTPTEPGTIIGRVIGTSADRKREFAMYYALLDLGDETLVARYVGPFAQLAYNEGPLRASLLSLEARSMIAGDLQPVAQLAWAAASPERFVTLPADWVAEPRGPLPCVGFPQPQAAIAASPVQDFTVTIRAAVWSQPNVNPAQAAAACSARRGSLGAASYVLRQESLGVAYVVEGVFAAGQNQIIQLEVMAPESKSAYARAVLEAWARRVAQ